MEGFCGSPFWDFNVTWDTEIPDFTQCFQKTALVWVPFGFLWIFSPIEIYNQTKTKVPGRTWNGLNIFKIIFTLLLFAVSVTDMVRSLLVYLDDGPVYPAEYYASFIKSVSYILVLIHINYGRRRVVRTSPTLFLFFLLETIAELITYRSVLLMIFNDGLPYRYGESNFSFILTMISFPLVVGQLIFFSFAETKPNFSAGLETELESPEESSSFLSQITYWWFNRMAYLGYKKPLVMEDLWTLADHNTSKDITTHFDKFYIPMMKKALSEKESIPVKPKPPRIVLPKGDAEPPDVEIKEKEATPVAGIMIPIMKTFWVPLLISGLLKLVASTLTFVNPLVLNALISFVGSNDPYWQGYFFAASIFFSSMAESLMNEYYEYTIYCTSMRIKAAIISALYRKSLVLSSSARRNYTVGEVVNLMSVDIQRVMDYFSVVNMLWSAPLQIGLALYFLYQQIGISTLGGTSVMILLIPLNGWITVKMREIQIQVMKEKDRRTKLMSEVLGGIKVLKLCAWEESFQKKVMKFRESEVKFLTTQAYYSSVITFVFSSATFLVAIASFAMFVLISPSNILDANKAFVSLSLFNILRFPFAFLPMVITFSAMFVVSLKRINSFLSCDELDPNAITTDNSYNDAVHVHEGTFAWSSDDQPTLNSINVNVPKQSLVAIVGTVGAGKSSFLSALLGDMLKLSGSINIVGRIAYVPQQAWIQNATLKNNVLFMKPYDEKTYNKIIENCCLKPDLDILPGGDGTEIGEKGINLSGGQKQRVSLARAVYNDADIYLLDDPLSAVDSHVSKDLFENIIGPKGLLKNKTRVLVTHRITVLPDVDSIIVLKDGKVSEVGSYTELLERKGAFAEFLIQHLTQTTADPEEINEKDLILYEKIAETVGGPELRKQISHMSGGESENSELGSPSPSKASIPSRTSSIIGAGASSDLRRRTSTLGSQRTLTRATSVLKDVPPIKKVDQSKLIESETSEVGSVKMAVYISYFKACGILSIAAVVLSFALSNGFNIWSSIWLSEWSNDSLDPSTYNDTKLRDTRLGVYGALGSIETIFVLVASLVLSLCSLKGAQVLHDNSLDHMLRSPMSFFDTTPMGRILNRFTKDVDAIDSTIRFNIRMAMISIFRAIVALITISLQTAFFLVLVIPLGVLYYLLQKFYIATSRQLKRLESVSRSPIYTHFSETVSGATCIRAFGVSDKFISESNHRVDINHKSFFPGVAANRWLAVRLQFLGYVVSFLAALFAVLARDTLSPGITGLAVSYALTITVTLNMLVRSCADVETNIVSVERCLEYTTTPTEAEREIESLKPSPDWPTAGSVQFENYSVRYREGLDLVLRGISCDIKPMEKVGIVGRTGAGKSSLTLCLFRLIEAVEGRIIIDGVDIAKMGLYDLRAKLTIIPQDPVLFTGTLRLNLDPFDTHTDDELWLALEHAHLKAYVSSTDKGLEHQITEGGENLSVGQRQLLCLARALLRKTKILIMDEATAAVDMETDELIQTTIRKEFSDCTVLTIAHRLNTILDYDKVMVLDKGKIVEYDTPENLLKDEKSHFHSMAKDADLV